MSRYFAPIAIFLTCLTLGGCAGQPKNEEDVLVCTAEYSTDPNHKRMCYEVKLFPLSDENGAKTWTRMDIVHGKTVAGNFSTATNIAAPQATETDRQVFEKALATWCAKNPSDNSCRK